MLQPSRSPSRTPRLYHSRRVRNQPLPFQELRSQMIQRQFVNRVSFHQFHISVLRHDNWKHKERLVKALVLEKGFEYIKHVLQTKHNYHLHICIRFLTPLSRDTKTVPDPQKCIWQLALQISNIPLDLYIEKRPETNNGQIKKLQQSN